MRYTNPVNGALRFQKAWFFLESGVQHVMVNVLQSTSQAPVYSVLDQKRRVGETSVEGTKGEASGAGTETYTSPTSIWHDRIGYIFPPSNSGLKLGLRTGPVTGDWAKIGASEQPPTTVDLWAAWLEHTDVEAPVEYTIWPGIGLPDFQSKFGQAYPVHTIKNTKEISTVHDKNANHVMSVFWAEEGGSFDIELGENVAPLTVSSDKALAMMVSLEDGTITASDPSQTLKGARITFELGATGDIPTRFWTGDIRKKVVDFTFPTGGRAGNLGRGKLGDGSQTSVSATSGEGESSDGFTDSEFLVGVGIMNVGSSAKSGAGGESWDGSRNDERKRIYLSGVSSIVWPGGSMVLIEILYTYGYGF